MFLTVGFFVCPLICRGADVTIENMHQGFTHVFESTLLLLFVGEFHFQLSYVSFGLNKF